MTVHLAIMAHGCRKQQRKRGSATFESPEASAPGHLTQPHSNSISPGFLLIFRRCCCLTISLQFLRHPDLFCPTSSKSGSFTLKMISACFNTSTEDSATCTPPCLRFSVTAFDNMPVCLQKKPPTSCSPHLKILQRLLHLSPTKWRNPSFVVLAL